MIGTIFLQLILFYIPHPPCYGFVITKADIYWAYREWEAGLIEVQIFKILNNVQKIYLMNESLNTFRLA